MNVVLMKYKFLIERIGMTNNDFAKYAVVIMLYMIGAIFIDSEIDLQLNKLRCVAVRKGSNSLEEGV